MAKLPFSLILETNGEFHTSGILPGPVTEKCTDDFETQIRNLFANMDEVLNSKALTARNVRAVEIWITGSPKISPKEFERRYTVFNEAYVKWLGDMEEPPTRALTGPAKLKSGYAIEMQVHRAVR
ncbi:RidA family protein [Patescibacteria group bacterium]|nr:RidA family protein [Patescibacteria group bacterium]